ATVAIDGSSYDLTLAGAADGGLALVGFGTIKAPYMHALKTPSMSVGRVDVVGADIWTFSMLGVNDIRNIDGWVNVDTSDFYFTANMFSGWDFGSIPGINFQAKFALTNMPITWSPTALRFQDGFFQVPTGGDIKRIHGWFAPDGSYQI